MNPFAAGMCKKEEERKRNETRESIKGRKENDDHHKERVELRGREIEE